MISFFNKHKKVIFVFTTVFFLGGIFVGLGAYLVGDMGTRNAVARVGKKNISYDAFMKNVSQYISVLQERGNEIDENTQKEIKKQVLEDMIVREVLSQSARQYKMTVSDYELAEYITSVPYFQKDGKFTPEIYRRVLWKAFRMKAPDFENDTRQRMLADKFKSLLLYACKLTPGETMQAFMLESKMGKNSKEQKESISSQIKQMKFLALANYHLSLFNQKNGLQDFLEKRERGE